MNRTNLRVLALSLAITGVLAAAPAMAKKDEDGRGNPHQSGHAGKKGEKGPPGKDDDRIIVRFDDDDRDVLRRYFRTEFDRGNCPPGLAKKRNGCLPPGQAKKWRVGERLPGDVRFYDLPDWVLRELGAPPSGHRYVRVDDDILLLAIGTSLVVDALSDLGGF